MNELLRYIHEKAASWTYVPVAVFSFLRLVLHFKLKFPKQKGLKGLFAIRLVIRKSVLLNRLISIAVLETRYTLTMKNLEFSKQLIKGRTAEHIFEQLLRDTGEFTVLSFGYEKVLPELAQQQRTIAAEETMEIIRTAPDYAVINHQTKEVHLIEVKYRSHLDEKNILQLATRMVDSWKTAHLFVATPEGFYSDEVQNIIQNQGKIKALEHKQIPADLQKKYIKLMMSFLTEVSV